MYLSGSTLIASIDYEIIFRILVLAVIIFAKLYLLSELNKLFSFIYIYIYLNYAYVLIN